MINITVYGHPVPKARARVVRTKNGKTVSYTSAKTASWEESIRTQSLACRPETLLDGPLVLEATFYLLRSKSRPRRDKFPDRRPDLDNLVKSVKDALSGVIWTDDARIVDLVARKRYGNPPRVEIFICDAEKYVKRDESCRKNEWVNGNAQELKAENVRLRKLLALWPQVEGSITDGQRYHLLVADFSRRVRVELARRNSHGQRTHEVNQKLFQSDNQAESTRENDTPPSR